MQKSRSGPVPLYLQKAFLLSAFPESTVKLGGDTLVWDGKIQPTALSQIYDVRIEYKLWGPPRSYLISPDGRAMADEISPGRVLPHRYKEDPHVQMCIYHPSKQEWNSSMVLARTIVPWMALWLSYFEDWVVTDVWSGGGEHIELKEEPEVAKV